MLRDPAKGMDHPTCMVKLTSAAKAGSEWQTYGTAEAVPLTKQVSGQALQVMGGPGDPTHAVRARE